MKYAYSLMFLYFLASTCFGQDNIWQKASFVSGVSAQKIYAIALAESGMKMSDGKMRPWPWTINSPVTGAMRFGTKEEAYQAIKDLVGKGVRNIDLGMMQINLGWHWEKIKDRDVLDPSVNVMTAAEILRTLMSETKGDQRKAVAFYHSKTRDRANIYDQNIRKYEGLIMDSEKLANLSR